MTVALLLAACTSTTPGAPVNHPSGDPTLTQAIVQRKLTEYFGKILGQIPQGLTLAHAAPLADLEAQGPSFAVPCDDNDQTGSGPLSVQDEYWVHGISNGTQQSTLDAFGAAFTSKGWRVKKEDADIIRGFTPDGYVLVANLNTAGGLSLSGSTPCFPAVNEDRNAIGPTSIPHP